MGAATSLSSAEHWKQLKSLMTGVPAVLYSVSHSIVLTCRQLPLQKEKKKTKPGFVHMYDVRSIDGLT